MSSLSSISTASAALRSWAEIDLAALLCNLAAMRTLSPGAGIMAVVKANAYGHGLPEITHALAGKVEMFGVANLTEARACAKEALETPIFLLGAALPAEREAVAREGFLPAISSVKEAAAYAALAPTTGKGKVRVHLALDTGMGRMGAWEEEAVAFARAAAALPGLEITGVFSHLPSADEDDAYTAAQLARFHGLVSQLRAAGLALPVVHVENSAGLIGFPQQVGTLARTGLALYGVAPRPEFQPRLQNVLTWKTRVLLVRDFGPGRGVSYGRTFITPKSMRIATLAVGYADGFPRQVSGRGAAVLIGGRRCPVLGRVTMDQIMADVTDVPAAAPGDEAVLVGRQGSLEIPATELAACAGTIAYDIFTGIGQRVVRCYAPAS